MIWPEIVSLVARREIRERAYTRAYVASTAVLLALVVGLTLLSTVGGGGSSASIGTAGPGAAALARSAGPRASAADLQLKPKAYPDVAAARKAVRDGDIGSALVVTASGGARLLVGKDASRTAVALVQGVLAEGQAVSILTRAGVSRTVATRAIGTPGPPIEVITLPRTGTSRGIAYVAALLLYLAILTYGVFISSGIVTEKATRVVEVILSAVRPIELLAGKVVGLGLLSLSQFGLLAVVALGTAEIGGVDLPTGAPLAIALAVLFSLLGYLLYACAFAVAGSLVSRQEDLQSASAPLTIVLVAGFVLTQFTLSSPNGTLAKTLSLIPPTAPLAMPSRVALSDVPAWQIALSAGLTLATALVVLRIAASVYTATVLRMGQRVPLREALRLGRACRVRAALGAGQGVLARPAARAPVRRRGRARGVRPRCQRVPGPRRARPRSPASTRRHAHTGCVRRPSASRAMRADRVPVSTVSRVPRPRAGRPARRRTRRSSRAVPQAPSGSAVRARGARRSPPSSRTSSRTRRASRRAAPSSRARRC